MRIHRSGLWAAAGLARAELFMLELLVVVPLGWGVARVVGRRRAVGQVAAGTESRAEQRRLLHYIHSRSGGAVEGKLFFCFHIRQGPAIEPARGGRR